VRQKASDTIFKWICLLIFAALGNVSLAQSVAAPSAKSISNSKKSFGSTASFIQNIGQYGQKMQGYEAMGKIMYGYEGLEMPVLFTSKGLIHLYRKIDKISHAEEERLEKQGVLEEEIERRRNITDRVITMEWLNANPDVKIIAEERETAYHTYGIFTDKAYGYKKITYKNIYPGIDVVYNFTGNTKIGFEYNLIVQPGADLSAVKLKYGGDVKTIKTDERGILIIKSDIDGISTTVPVTYYSEKLLNKNISDVKTGYKIVNNEISFSFPNGYDSTKAFIIDPFVSGTGSLIGLNAGKARDVDFDYNGNIYVTGGGSQSSKFSLAKYNAAGVLQWTFNGALAIPSWTSNSYYGGWMVEKPTGNVYMGQGFIYPTGFRVIRISTTGLYDNYITTANGNFTEAWKMFWSCNNGTPQILIAGGGINSNVNFGVFTPPSTTVNSLNVTGIPMGFGGNGGWAQDIADFVFDPVNNDMYSIYGSLFGTPSLGNKIYKNTAPYSAAGIAWNAASGYNTVSEAANRPYLGNSLVDNSANMLWVNASYLYYWDGRNLKAFNKATGAGVGTPLTLSNTPFMQGGIIADACNNIFVGEGNGVIKVYNFNGTTFSDAPPDIAIPGFNGKAVYDLAYDEAKKLLYASGDGFVASFDITAYCPTTLYTINVIPDCLTASATATVTPATPPGAIITYALFIGTTQIASNTTGIFTGLNPNITYTIVATINLACSGSQATTTFIVPGPTVGVTQTNTICGANTGTITATGSGTAGPYTYNINGGAFQPGGNFTGLAAGVYTIIVKDANGCPNSTVVTIVNSNGPVFTFAQTNANCGSNNGLVTITASGGTAPYQYSSNNGTTYQSGNFFTGLLAGQYTFVVKDANGCTNAAIVTITSSPPVFITAIPASATCGNNNGTITVFGSGGTAPLQYSINGNIFQAGNVFSGLTPGIYTVTVKDANGCINTATVTIGNSPAPTVTAIATASACNNINGTILATGAGGIAPLLYSINGIIFQANGLFNGLAAGAYTITVKDATGCTGTATVTVSNIGGPSVTAASTVSSCGANTGSVTAAGSGGTPAYQYSINGITFQAGNTFLNLPPGNYVVYVKDVNGCIGTFTITVGVAAGPSLTAVAIPTACNSNNGSITATAGGGLAPYQYSIDGVTYGAAFVFTNLATGVYTVYVKDANNCIKSITVTITNSSNLSLTASTISSGCSGNSGTITATATGGVLPLQYSINGVTYQAGNVFTGVAAGIYTVYVKDANNCIVTNAAVVASIAGPSFTVTVQQNATCGTASGVIIANGSGGVAPLTYNIDGGAYQSVNIFINVAPGIHTITVKDATGCVGPLQTATITNAGAGTAPTDVTFNIQQIMPCAGTVGKIKNLKGVPGGGGNTYTFSLDNGPFTTANQFINVPAGIHTITAKNQNGCTVTRIAIMGNGTPATATATATASICGGNTGTITIAGVGGSVPYHASIDGSAIWQTFFPPGANTFTFNGLTPGTHVITMADDADFSAGPPDDPGACLTTIYVTVPSTGGPSISTTQINPTCTSNTGSITVTGSGGILPYTYNIDGGAYSGITVFNNLAPGVHAVNVKDGSGCTNGINVTLPGQSVPMVTAVIQNTSCNEDNGTITATGSGGTAQLEYSINGTIFQTSNVFFNLATGSYTLYVKDANACFSSIPVSILSIAIPAVTAYTIAASCNNSDGSIVATGISGKAPYTYSINGIVYQSSNIFSGLTAGFYTVYLKDDRGCIITTGVTIANIGAPTFTAAIVAAKCGNPNGSITVTATGGTPAYEYSSDGGVSFQTNNVLAALTPGNHVIIVRDANGCIASQTIFVTNIIGPQTLTAAIVHASCGNANGSITATVTGGTAPLQYSRDGVTYQVSPVFNGVPANNYTLYVKDNNGCIKPLPVEVLNLPGPVVTTASSPSSCGLSDGTITVTATGGTLLLTYSKDGGLTYQASNIFTGLAATTYSIVVKDARNCTSIPASTIVAVIGSAVIPAFTPIGPLCQNSAAPQLPLTSVNGINGTWSPAVINTTTAGTTIYTFTPATGQCATVATMNITITALPTATISYAAPFCANNTTTQSVTLTGTAGGIFSAAPAGLTINATTGAIIPNTSTPATYIVTYTVTAGGGCAGVTATTSVTINPKPASIIIYHN
jgi:SprB repeat